MLVQLPAVLKLVPDLRLRLELSEHVRATVRNFVPVFVSRGVVQISAYIDEVLASLLPTGAVTGLANAQLLYTLPVSLFGLSVSAAALPAMSGAVGLDAMQLVRDRVNTGLRHIAFFVVPSAVAFLTLGDVVAAALFQTGRFTYADAVYVWGILAGSSIGLLATTLARLYSSTYYALRDTRTPLRYALVHVAIATVLGYFAAIVLPPMIGIDASMGNRRTDDSRQHRRMGRAAAASPIAESAHRRRRACRWRWPHVYGARPSPRPPWRWAIKMTLPETHPIPARR